MSFRFVVLISIFSSYFLTTSPEDLTQSMVQLKVPYDYALTFNMAMRFVPTLSKEAQIIMDAQKSRGLEMEKGNFMQKIRNYIPVLVPLIVSSFRRAELVADAMESRAFGATKKRTSLYVLQLGNIDYAFLCIVIASSEALLLTSLLFGFR
jgi:energy-coupling factor transport system permease protein